MKSNYNDLALAILRISFSSLMLTHGIPKIGMLFSNPSGFPDPFGIGGTGSLLLALLGEVIAPIFVFIGLKTRLATIPTIITMMVAAFVIHLQDDFGVKEKALLYMFGFIVIAIAGAGKYALDGRK